MKKTLKLIPALAMLLVSAILVSTSTYAWFSMNNQVTVTGMTIKTEVNDNLLIAETNEANAYGTSLAQTRKALLEPSSTINGIDYYWTSTTNVDGIGNAKAETYTQYNESTSRENAAAGKAKYDTAFTANYAKTPGNTVSDFDTAFGYVDYTFYLKATNVSTTGTATLRLTKLNLLYNNAALNDTDHSDAGLAWRAALIVQDAQEYTALATAPTAANVVSIFTLSGAENFDTTGDKDWAVGAVANSNPAVQNLSYGVDTGNSNAAFTAYNVAGVVDGAIAANTTAYYKVTVRFWLEGEDTTCTNQTYAALTEQYKLDLKFELATDTAAVTSIGSVAP